MHDFDPMGVLVNLAKTLFAGLVGVLVWIFTRINNQISKNSSKTNKQTVEIATIKNDIEQIKKEIQHLSNSTTDKMSYDKTKWHYLIDMFDDPEISKRFTDGVKNKHKE